MSCDGWQTPDGLLDAARQVLCAIDLDPCSTASAQRRVQAALWYGDGCDGLAEPWRGRCWINPPFSRGSMRAWSEKLVAELELGNVTAALFLCNVDPSTSWWNRLSERFLFCLLRKRVAFVDPETGRVARGNNRAQAVFYVGAHGYRFREVFGRLGGVYG